MGLFQPGLYRPNSPPCTPASHGFTSLAHDLCALPRRVPMGSGRGRCCNSGVDLGWSFVPLWGAPQKGPANGGPCCLPSSPPEHGQCSQERACIVSSLHCGTRYVAQGCWVVGCALWMPARSIMMCHMDIGRIRSKDFKLFKLLLRLLFHVKYPIFCKNDVII